MFRLSSVLCCALSLFAVAQATETVLEFGGKLLDDCGSDWTCVKPKLLKYIGESVQMDELKLTRDLSLKRSHGSEDEEEVANSIPNGGDYKQAVKGNSALKMLDRIDDFLSTHELHVSLPEELGSSIGQIKMPLTTDQEEQSGVQQGRSRGFVRKIVIPFLLGLKFKTTVLIPVAIAIIALKTWKALTLGLLSLVLSAAMVIYKFTKPKVVGVEILHYPSPVHAHHHDAYAHARAYSAQQPSEQYYAERLILNIDIKRSYQINQVNQYLYKYTNKLTIPHSPPYSIITQRVLPSNAYSHHGSFHVFVSVRRRHGGRRSRLADDQRRQTTGLRTRRRQRTGNHGTTAAADRKARRFRGTRRSHRDRVSQESGRERTGPDAEVAQLRRAQKQTPQVEENPHAHHGVRHAQGPDPDPARHRRVGLEGVERPAAVVLLVRHLHRTGHLPAGQESFRIAAIVDHPRCRNLRRPVGPLRQEHPGTRPSAGLRFQPSQIDDDGRHRTPNPTTTTRLYSLDRGIPRRRRLDPYRYTRHDNIYLF